MRAGPPALRPYRDSGLADRVRASCRAAGLSEQDAQAVVQAGRRLDARRRGGAVRTMQPALGTDGGAGAASEVGLLERVATCYRRSPIVPPLRARRQRGPAPSSPAVCPTR
jgi:hypothetical protein